VLFGLNKHEQAADSFRQALSCDPNYAEAWNNLGNALAELGSDSEAVEAFRQALRLVPDYEDARTNLAATLREHGGQDDAPKLRVLL
jgi:superkiller protein 3